MDRQTGRGKAVRLAAACTECQQRKQKVHLCLQAQVSKVKESSPDHLSSAAVNGPVIIVRQGGSPIFVDLRQRCPELPVELLISQGLYKIYTLKFVVI